MAFRFSIWSKPSESTIVFSWHILQPYIQNELVKKYRVTHPCIISSFPLPFTISSYRVKIPLNAPRINITTSLPHLQLLPFPSFFATITWQVNINNGNKTPFSLLDTGSSITGRSILLLRFWEKQRYKIVLTILLHVSQHVWWLEATVLY